MNSPEAKIRELFFLDLTLILDAYIDYGQVLNIGALIRCLQVFLSQ